MSIRVVRPDQQDAQRDCRIGMITINSQAGYVRHVKSLRTGTASDDRRARVLLQFCACGRGG